MFHKHKQEITGNNLNFDKEYFTCRCCKYILKDPMECARCYHPICEDCAIRTDFVCNNCGCNQPKEFKKINSFAKRHLHKSKFTCRNHDLWKSENCCTKGHKMKT